MTALRIFILLFLPFHILCDETSKNGRPSWYDEDELVRDTDEHSDYLDWFPEETDEYEYESHANNDKQHPYQESRQHPQIQNNFKVPQNQLLQYDYEVQTLSGISDPTLKHSSGTIMRAKVNFFRANTQQCLMQFGDVKFGKLNKQVDPQSSENFNQFEPVNVDQKLVAFLQLPIKFNCDTDQASFLITDGDDQPWSTNIKRGVLDLLLHDFDQIFRNYGRPVSSLSLEDNVEGKCIAEYRTEKNTKIKGHVINVTKTIDHETCVRKPEIKHNFRTLTKCNPDNDAEEVIKKSGSTTFVVAMTKNFPRVVSAEAKNQYAMILSSDRAHQLLTVVNQKIKFVAESPSKSVSDLKNPAKTKTGRIYSTEWDSSYERALMFGRQKHSNHVSPLNTFGQIVDVLKKAFNGLSKITQSKSQKSVDQIEALLETATILRLTSLDDLKNFEKSLKLTVDEEQQSHNTEQYNALNDQYAQALGICGSKTCVQRLIQLIHTNRVSPIKAILALNEIRNAPVISTEIVKEVVTLARSLEQQDFENKHSVFTLYFLKQGLWLLSGSLVRDLCSSTTMDKFSIRQEQNSPILCMAQFKQNFVRLVVKNLKKSTEWQDQIVFIKTLGNAGLLESVADLKKLIYSKQKDQQFLRSSAIYAMKKMAISRPQYIESLLKPIIEDNDEEQELRIASIHVLLSSNPDKAFVDYLTEIQERERKSSSQVASYISSILRKMSASSSHCTTNAKTRFTDTLHSLKCRSQNQSFTGSFSFNCPAVGAGIDADFELSYCNGSNESCDWPFHQVFDLNADWLGFQQKSLFSLAVVSFDGQELMQKTSQAFWHASKQKPQSMDDLWGHEIGSTASKSERISDIIVSVINYIRGIKKQDQKTNRESLPKAVVYLKFKDQNIGFLPISDKLIAQALPDIMHQIKRIENDLKKLLTFDLHRVSMLYDVHYKTATSAGIPISVSFKQPALFNFKGKISSLKELSPSLAIDSQLDSSMSARMATVIDMQIWTPVVVSGVKYENRLTLDLSLKGQLNGELKGKKQTFKITLPKPEEHANILELKSKTSSYNTLWSKYVSDLSGKDEKTLISKNQIMTKYCLEEPITGAKICAKTINKPQFGQYNLFTPKKLIVWSEANQLQTYPVEIEIATNRQNQRSSDTSDNDYVIFNNVRIRSKSNARQATLSFVHMRDPADTYFKIKAIFAKQWKSDTLEPLLVCFDAEKLAIPENYDKTQKNAFKSSLNWGASTCQSTQHVAVKVLHTKFPAKNPALESCTKDSCHSDDTNKPFSTLIVDINYQRVPVPIKNVTNKLYRSLKHVFYAKADVAQIDVKNAAGKIWSKIVLTSDACGQEADVTLKIPGENITFHNIAIPSWLFQSFKTKLGKKILQPPPRHFPENIHVDRVDHFDDRYDTEEPESVWSWLHHKSHKQPVKEDHTFNHDDNVLKYEDPSKELDEEGSEMWPNKNRRKESRAKENPHNSDLDSMDWNHSWKEDAEDLLSTLNAENNKLQGSKQFAREKLKKGPRASDNTFKSETIKTCHVSPNSVETFETVSYKFGLPECYTIISKDCSKNGQYIVMTKKNGKTQKFSKLFILTDQHKILLKVEQQNGKEQRFKLFTDDVEQTLNENVETLAKGSHDIRFMKHANHVDIQLMDMKIDIEFELSSITLKMPEKSTRNQCGLCGQSQNQDSSYKKWPTVSGKILRKYIIEKYVVKSRDCKIYQPKQDTSSQYRKPATAGEEFDPNIDGPAAYHGNHPYVDRDDVHLYDDYHQYDDYSTNLNRKWDSDDEMDDYGRMKFF